MSGASTFNGGVTINGGAISVNSLSTGGTSASALGKGPADASGQSLTFNGGQLIYTGASTTGLSNSSNALSNNFNITVLSGGGTISTNSSYISLAGSLSGSGNLTFSNNSYVFGNADYFSTTTNDASQNFTGNITITNAQVQLRSAATHLMGNAANVIVGPNGGLSADTGSTNPSIFTNPIELSGGSLTTQGVAMNYSGPVTVDVGTTSYVGYRNNGTNSPTLSGNLSGAGTVSTIGTPGAETVTLSGTDNSGFMGTWQSTGISTIFSSSGAGSPNATWVANGQGFNANIAGGGTVSMGALSGTTGTVSNVAAATTSTFSVGALGTNTTFGGLITNGGATAVTALTKVGTGSLALTGPYNYTGLTTVSGGTLQLGNPATAPNAASVTSNGIVVNNNSTLVFANAGTQTLASQISGSGTVVFNGPGNVLLAASQAYTGPTVVQGGTLSVVAVVPAAMQLGFYGSTADFSGNNNNAFALSGTTPISTTPIYAAGVLPTAQSISLGGSAATQYEVIKPSPSLNLSGAFTVSLWEKCFDRQLDYGERRRDRAVQHPQRLNQWSRHPDKQWRLALRHQQRELIFDLGGQHDRLA